MDSLTKKKSPVGVPQSFVDGGSSVPPLQLIPNRPKRNQEEKAEERKISMQVVSGSVLLLTVVLLCAAAVQAGSSSCASQTTCDGCTGSAGCGWCASSQTCSAGGSAGPSTGSCAKWHWLGANCPTPQPPTPAPTIDCFSYSNDCTACTQAPSLKCGWCGQHQGSSKCVIGTSTGPSNGTCTYWNWYPDQC